MLLLPISFLSYLNINNIYKIFQNSKIIGLQKLFSYQNIVNYLPILYVHYFLYE